MNSYATLGRLLVSDDISVADTVTANNMVTGSLTITSGVLSLDHSLSVPNVNATRLNVSLVDSSNIYANILDIATANIVQSYETTANIATANITTLNVSTIGNAINYIRPILTANTTQFQFTTPTATAYIGSVNSHIDVYSTSRLEIGPNVRLGNATGYISIEPTAKVKIAGQTVFLERGREIRFLNTENNDSHGCALWRSNEDSVVFGTGLCNVILLGQNIKTSSNILSTASISTVNLGSSKMKYNRPNLVKVV